MAEQANWYVAHTYSGYENKVATDLMTMVENRHLQDLICDVKVPTETRIEEVFDKRGNKTGEKEVQSKLYPGYVFVKMVMNDNTWYIVRNTRGCTGFVGPESKPEPLTEAEVAKMGVETTTDIEVEYKVGDTVGIKPCHDLMFGVDRDTLLPKGFSKQQKAVGQRFAAALAKRPVLADFIFHMIRK